jgi:hypothetical protein
MSFQRQHAYRDDVEYYEDRAESLLAAASGGGASALAAFERWEMPANQAGARVVVARLHGFQSWAELLLHVAMLPDGEEPFARAYRALEAGDADALRAELDAEPELASARGTDDDDLLGLAAGAGHVALVALLLQRGAAPGNANLHGRTALHAAATAGHREAIAALLDAGADPTARDLDGHTPADCADRAGHADAAQALRGRG